MPSHVVRFVFFLGFACLGCGSKPEEQAVLVGVREVASGPVKESPAPQPESLPAACALVFSEGEWRLSREQAKQLRRDPSAIGAAASLHSLGVKLDSVAPEGLAACVGLRAGDVLASVGAVSLMSPLEALPRLEAMLSMGGLWTLRYWRGASLRKVKVRVVEAP